MHTHPRCRRAIPHSGTAASEFAITLPLLVAFGLGGVDFARLAHVSISLENAARVGAEYGATNRFSSAYESAWSSELIERVMTDLNALPEEMQNDILVSVSTEEFLPELLRVTVEVECPFETVIDWPLMPDDITVIRRVSMCQYR